MKTDTLEPKIAFLAGHLVPAGKHSIRKLQQALAENVAHEDLQHMLAPPLSFERADAFSDLALSTDVRKQLSKIVKKARPKSEKREPQYRVFRRESPIITDFSRGGRPEWARGAQPHHSMGPYVGKDGRNFWFDFYPIIQVVSLYIGNSTTPAILFPIDLKKLDSKVTGPSRAPKRQQKLGAGSIYIHGSLLDPNAPAGQYVSLAIEGGMIAISGGITIKDNELRLKTRAKADFSLQLAKDKTTRGRATPQAGADFNAASLTLPSEFDFTISQQGLTITKLARAKWKVYGTTDKFSWDTSAAPRYEPELLRILIPYQIDDGNFEVKKSESGFHTFSGSADIQEAAWALPLSAIDLQQPTAATGKGGLVARAKTGLESHWRGLQQGTVRLTAPWIYLDQQLLALRDTAAGNAAAGQAYQLWPEGQDDHHSTLHIQYTAAFPWWYVSSGDQEMLGVLADTELKGDRPQQVDGLPLKVRTKASLLILAFNDTQSLIALYDDNILFDNYQPQNPTTLPQPIAIAIRNALFTTTPVNGLFLFGRLAEDQEVVTQGNLLLTMGLYYYLPTLPDPYAANLGVLGRRLGTLSDRGFSVDNRLSVTQLLIAQVQWTPPQDPAEESDVKTAFLLAPLPEGGFPLPQATDADRPVRDNVLTTAQDTHLVFANNFATVATGSAPPRTTTAFSATATHTAAADVPRHEDNWNEYFGVLTNDTFALLDVSTRADLMGISFNFINDETHLFMTTHAAQDDGANGAILQIRELDMSTQARYARAFTLPQISWEPLINLTPGPLSGDPPILWNLYPNDGGPTRLGTTGTELVPLAPLPVTNYLMDTLHSEEHGDGTTWALFALPFGMKAFAMMERSNGKIVNSSDLQLIQPLFPNDLRGGLQIMALTGVPINQGEDGVFKGATLQFNNVLNAFGQPTFSSTLGELVADIFNREFMLDPSPGIRQRGVPLKRIDLSGYGASTFSKWLNDNAQIAQTSQARFDVFVGRTAHEVIQVRSLLYPWGIKVVRTITVFRVSSAFVYRFDSGWQPESDGLFDFSYRVPIENFDINTPNPVEARPSPYEFHPGTIRGLFNIRDIEDTKDIDPFDRTWNKTIYAGGDRTLDNTFINANKAEEVVTGPMSVEISLSPVYFTADVEIAGVVQGHENGRVPSRKILGFVQTAPAAQPLSRFWLRELLNYQLGAIGGNIDCVLALAQTKQLMRINRFEVSPSVTAANNPNDPIFVGATRGSVILPKDGSWSMVQQAEDSGEVSPLPNVLSLPLIQEGKMTNKKETHNGQEFYKTVLPPANSTDPWRLANAIDLLRPPQPDTVNFAFLQNTDTQKALFRLPAFKRGVETLLSAQPDFADGYRLINSTGIFPNINDTIPMPLNGGEINIIEEGYRLLTGGNPTPIEIPLPTDPLILVDEHPYLKIYIEYKDDSSNGKLSFGLDSLTADVGKKWLSKMDNIRMVVDLGPIERMMIISGKFDAEKGAEPGFVNPVVKFNETYLQPIIDLLTILSTLSKDPTDPKSYGDLLQKGLEIAMSNSPDSWEYRMHAVKEIPVIKFPPPAVASAADPLKIEAGLRVGCYFNQPFKLTSDIEQLLPSAGAFLEFYGRLSVMCASVGAATIYATGSVNLGLAADIKLGPVLTMSYGFGAEIVVGLPVAGNVSLLFMVGVDIYMDKAVLVVGAFLLFKGRAEILGGIVTIGIMIEAKGSIKKELAGPEPTTEMIAQVTFAIDISICWVININITESWKESRKVA